MEKPLNPVPGMPASGVPVPGMILNYDYIWAKNPVFQRPQPVKTRPCIVVFSSPIEDDPGRFSVIVVPLTHSRPLGGKANLPMPSFFLNRLHYETPARTWVILSEWNVADYPGPHFKSLHTGRLLPESFMEEIRNRLIDEAREERLKVIRHSGDATPRPKSFVQTYRTESASAPHFSSSPSL